LKALGHNAPQEWYDEMYENMDALCDCLGVFMASNPEGYDGWFFGRSFTSIGDDETGKQFKNSIEEVIDAIFGPGIKCMAYQVAWYS